MGSSQKKAIFLKNFTRKFLIDYCDQSSSDNLYIKLTVVSIITKANPLKRSNVEVQTEVKNLDEALLVLEEKRKKVKR